MHPTVESDEDLLLASSSDVDAFGRFYDRNIGALLAYFAARTADGHLAAELAAETFAEAFVARRRFATRGDGSARAWLLGIGRHQLGRYARRQRVSSQARRKLGIAPLSIDEGEAHRIESLADLDGVRAELREALASLPVGQRDAVRLRVMDELPYAQVAAQLGCSEGAARVRVARALAQLAEVMGR